MSQPDQTNPQIGGESLWLLILWRARASLLIFAVAFAALCFAPQVSDMLANLADRENGTLENIKDAIGFQGAMIVLALTLWYWARAILLAWSGIADNADGREALRKAVADLHGESQARRAIRAFDLVPRGLFLGTALAALVAMFKSDKYIEMAVVVVWAVAFYYLLHIRIALQERLGLAPAAAPMRRSAKRQDASWLARVWIGFLELLDYAPISRRFAALALALAAGIFLASALTAFWPGSILVKIYLATYFSGPTVAMILLALSVAPLTALVYAVNKVASDTRIWRIFLPLGSTPVLFLLMLMIGLATQYMNLHALRVAKGSMTPAQRTSLAVMFQDWAASCTRNDGKPLRPVIVAVSGGASRAGLWAARVLETVDAHVADKHPGNTSIFMVSSVSGGSVGAAAYVAMRAAHSARDPKPGTGHCTLQHPQGADGETRSGAIIDAMRADAIGPVLAGALVGDVPRALAAYVPFAYDKITGHKSLFRGNDRAEALERAFENNWQIDGIKRLYALADLKNDKPVGFEQPYLSLFYGDGAVPLGDVPLWIANGTDAATGDRLITAPFTVDREEFCNDSGVWYAAPANGDTPPAGCGKPGDSLNWNLHGPFVSSYDVLGLVKADLPISTAIDNTSRFPFLSPSGELTPIDWNLPLPGDKERPHDAQIIDGGYFENEGIMTAAEVADWLRTYGPALVGRPVYPILVQATADADYPIGENEIARCSNRTWMSATFAGAARRSSQFLMPLMGVYTVRAGHSRTLLKEGQQAYCNEAGVQAFFHFYLYKAPNFDIPLNWMLSRKVGEYIWNNAILNNCGNLQELANLDAALVSAPAAPDPAKNLVPPYRYCVGDKTGKGLVPEILYPPDGQHRLAGG